MCDWKNPERGELPPDGVGFVACDESGLGLGVYEGGRWFDVADGKREMPRPPRGWIICDPPEWLFKPRLKLVK